MTDALRADGSRTTAFRRRVGIALLGALTLLAAPAFLAKASAAPGEAGDPRRLIAVGDLHGDYEAYIGILSDAGLIDDRGKWRGGDAALVQLGDLADRGPDSRKIIRHLRKLERQAARKGGAVVVLVGNHEAMTMTGDLRYVHPGEYEAFADRRSRQTRADAYAANRSAIEQWYRRDSPDLEADEIRRLWEEATPLGAIERRRAWSPDGDIGEWVVGLDIVVRIGRTLFVHGGISAEYANWSIEAMNAASAAALASGDAAPASIINDPRGPLWYRGLIRRVPAPPGETASAENPANGEAPPRSPAAEAAMVAAAFDVDRIVVGHTPSLDGARALHGGLVVQIDTGAAAYYGGTRSFLRIEDGAVFAHDDGAVRRLEEGGDVSGDE